MESWLEDHIESEVVRTIKTMEKESPGSDEYKRMQDHLDAHLRMLEKLREKPPTAVDKILGNPALLALIGNLSSIFIILNYEKTEAITSRAFSFIRPK